MKSVIIQSQQEDKEKGFDVNASLNVTGELNFQEMMYHMSTCLVAMAQSLQKIANIPLEKVEKDDSK